MDIDESYYRNVFLLMQVVPASYECTKHFTKGMFNKPNTSGFIHLSHYLLSIHNEERFKKMVIWPIWGKAEETIYRFQLKEYVELLSIENPEARLPVVLKTHLLQASGSKLLILMWKISQIALRAYMERTCSTELLNFPVAGENKSLTERYFLILNKKAQDDINKFLDEDKLILETFKRFVKYKSDQLESMQTAIFQLQENIEMITSTVPVNPSIIKRLKDIEDKEIIKLWNESIAQNVEYIKHKNSQLKRLKHMTERCINIIMNNVVLDGNDLPKVNSEALQSLNIQIDANSLYVNGCLVLQTLLAIFDQAFKRAEYYIRKDNMLDLTKWEPDIYEQCKNLKSMEKIYRKLAEEVSDQSKDCQSCSLYEKVKCCTLEAHSVCPASLQTILISPKYNLSAESRGKEIIFERMLVSPVAGKHDHLFRRYKRNLPGRPRTVPRIQFDFNDSTSSIVSTFKSPQRQTVKRSNETKVTARYYRLFSTPKSKKNFKDSNAASTPNHSVRNSMSGAIEGDSEKRIVDTNVAMTDIFDLS